MQISVDPRIQQVIDIQVADILDAYGIILGREFTKAHHRPFSHVATMEGAAKSNPC